MTTQKETLQPKDIVGYLPYGLKAIMHPYIVIEIMGVDLYRHYVQNMNTDNTFKIEEVKPLLYPLSHLTKEIPFNGGTIVPLIECAKVAFPDLDWSMHHKGYAMDKNEVYSFNYVENTNAFISMYKGNWDLALRQYQNFQLLYRYKIDFLGLIDKGLAVDVSTMNVNPYP